MAAVFNPNVQTFRFHVFSVRPCYELLSPAALTPEAAAFTSPANYYKADGTLGGLRFERLGRRSRDFKQIAGPHTYQPHRFWSRYLSLVAHADYRGMWFGFAPYRVRLDPQFLRLAQEFRADAQKRFPGLKSLSAFPRAYFTPLGWISSVAVEIAAPLRLDAMLAAAFDLRTKPAYSVRGAEGGDLSSVLVSIHRAMRAALLPAGKAGPADFDIHEFMVASPTHFDNQLLFNGRVEIDLLAVLRVLDPKGVVAPDRRLITADQHYLAVSAFNRGSMLMVRGIVTRGGNEDNEDRQPAPCALSNFKNVLMMSSIMQRYYQSAPQKPETLEMKAQVAKTFEQLSNVWQSRHYQALLKSHTGWAKLLC